MFDGNSCFGFLVSGCDSCNEWYHGDCINVTAEETQNIEKWYCKLCTGLYVADVIYTILWSGKENNLVQV